MNQLFLPAICILAAITTSFHVGFCSKTNINTDKSALLTLKSQLIITIPSNLETNWSTDSPVCSWAGITCGTHHRRIAAINLSFMGLGGTLPPHLGNLSFLTLINLRNNSFQGTIPMELFSLPRLRFADLGYNQFTGPIPSNLFESPSLRFVVLASNFLTGSVPTGRNTTLALETIDMGDNKLTGELPAEIFHHLPRLIIFAVSENMLTGSIPLSLSQCRFLQVLSLSYNDFGGSIPSEFGNLTMLTALFLGTNNLTGAIPSEIGDLMINLEYLSLPTNALTGEIPSSLANLTKLIRVGLETNSLKGPIPQQFGKNLQSLRNIFFNDNYLSGSLPLSIFNISSLETLNFAFNQFSGSLPPSIHLNLPNLQALVVSTNILSGTIPASIYNLSRLETLEMSENRFSGLVPNELGSLRQLQWVGLASNNLTLTSSPNSFFSSLANCRFLTDLWLANNPLNTILPSSIGNLSTTLQNLYLYGCQLKGKIPLQVGNLESLVTLALHSNRLSGTIPTIVGALENIQYLSLADNKLEGPIPHDICKFSRVAYIYLAGNALSGSIPSCLGSLSSLRKLTLSDNRLRQNIPSSLWNLMDIQVLDLSENSLSGYVPQEIGNLKVASEIYLYHNQFTGSIPSTIGNLINIQNLSFADNKLDGHIPESFGSLISLKFLDLSSNNLSGVIPKTLEKLSNLEHFNVSVNRLEGKIPDGGPFANFSAQSFTLNRDLCGSARFEVPLCKTFAPRNEKKSKALSRKYLIPIISTTSVVFGLLVLVLILVRRKRGNSVANSLGNLTEMVPMVTWRRVSYYELVQATNQFHESNFLGAGAFGSVFKGTLSDGMDIAVKVFNQNIGEAFESFHNECEVMRSIRHMNLVKVITSCSSPDLKCLIMEYMPNESLEKWLHGTNNLNILQRLSIVIDVAKALEYLHHGYSVPIIHCDLKPSNVLLDGDMVAHVADFGISKLLTGEDSITHTLTLATFGYTAPEYGLEGMVSTQGDVYSYGILLMETFAGKRPTEEMFAAGMSLPQWVKKSLPHNTHEIADFGLLDIEDQHFEKKIGCITEIMELALECCSEKREDRPNTTNISTKLKKMHVKLFHDPRFIP